jgi:hypothetical protein
MLNLNYILLNILFGTKQTVLEQYTTSNQNVFTDVYSLLLESYNWAFQF